MSYKWKPSKSAKREFADNMKNPDYAAAYYGRKEAKADKRRATSQFDYASAGGQYVPTQAQYNCAVRNMGTGIDNDCNMVIYGYTCQEKVHHDHIHVINELIRAGK